MLEFLLSIWLSRDAGQNWTQKINGISTTIAINKTNPNIIYTILQGNGVYKSTNAGDNWTLLNNGLPVGGIIEYSELSISDGSPNILYASIVNASNFSNQGLYKTIDSDVSWTQVNKPTDYNCQPFNQSRCQGWYNNVVAVSPFNSDLLVAGGVTLWLTDDSGTNWTNHDAAGTFSSENNNGKTFIDNLKVKFSPLNPNIVVSASGLQDHGLYAQDNSNGNLVATRWGFSDGARVNINLQDDNIIYGDYIFGRHRKNTNRGTSNSASFFVDNGIPTSDPGQVFETTTIIDRENPEILYYCSTTKIYKTINGATLWVPKANIANGRQLEIDKVNNNHIYLATWSNTGSFSFYHSAVAGENWVQTNTNPSWRVTSIDSDPFTEGTIYVTRNSAFVNNPHVLKSVDYGNTWQNITNDLSDIGVSDVLVNPLNNNYLYLATDLGVYASENGGQNWVEYNDGMPVTFSMDLNYNIQEQTLRVGTFGRGVWKTPAIPDIILGTNDFNTNLTTVSVYLNPTKGELNLTINQKKSTNLAVKLYSINGQLISTLYNNTINSGFQETPLTFGNKNLKIEAGIYFVKIITEGNSITKKIIIN